MSAASTPDHSPEVITFLVHGAKVSEAPAQRSGSHDASANTQQEPAQVASFRLHKKTRGGDGPVESVTATPGQDIVRIKLENGPVLSLHPAVAKELLQAQRTYPKPGALTAIRSRGAQGAAPKSDEVHVQALMAWPEPKRSEGQAAGAARGWFDGVVIELFEVVFGAVKDQITQEMARKIAQSVDESMRPSGIENVYQLTTGVIKQHDLKPAVFQNDSADPASPYLVLIHGTFSSTEGTFGKLWKFHPELVKTLFDQYSGRVLALDHQTLTCSPIQNAITLIKALPKNSTLHLITHSRGGLIGEILAQVSTLATSDTLKSVRWQKLLDDFNKTKGNAGEQQARYLNNLLDLIKEKKIKVEHIVRVACPAQGTLLAGKRLDVVLSIFQWVLELAQIPIAPTLVELLNGVARCRESLDVLPGLAMQVPESLLVQWLSDGADAVEGKLSIIAGAAAKGDGVMRWVATLMADTFYQANNDFVVQTSSMFGGAARLGGTQYLLEQNHEVSHFGYFKNLNTATTLVAALTDHADSRRMTRHESLSVVSTQRSGSQRQRGADAPVADAVRPAVFILPGVGASHLSCDGERLWLTYRVFGNFLDLDLKNDTNHRVRPDGILDDYAELSDYLRRTHEVIEFDYDWRRSLRDEAIRLAKDLEKHLDAREATGQPVRILAHSMGGLLARTVALQSPKIWTRLMAHDAARLLMLGTPNGGSWVPMQCLTGDDTWGNLLVAVGAPLKDKQARQMMAEFPGFIELQAGLNADSTTKLSDHDAWKRLYQADEEAERDDSLWHYEGRTSGYYQWGIPNQTTLNEAQKLRTEWDAQRDGDLALWANKCALVVGQSKLTPSGYFESTEGLQYHYLRDGGDGRVTYQNAILPGVKTWRIPVIHGALASEARYFSAFYELLDKGDTQELEPMAEMMRGQKFEDVPGLFADRTLISRRPSKERSGILGITPRLNGNLGFQDVIDQPDRSIDRTIRIDVFNGDLRYVDGTVMLGHYASSDLTGAEKMVDQCIGNAMSHALMLSDYPSGIGEIKVFKSIARSEPATSARRLQSVIVVGLGHEGKIRHVDLVKTVKAGALAAAQQANEQKHQSQASSLTLTCTLIGSGGASISAARSAMAIIEGVLEADSAIRDLNDQLIDEGSGQEWPRFGGVRLVELYLNRAGEAWRAVKQFAESDQGGAIRYGSEIKIGDGALRRPLDGGYRGSNYDYFRAEGFNSGATSTGIRFSIDTRKRARTEVFEHTLQRTLIYAVLNHSSKARYDDPEIGHALFNLIIPVDMTSLMSGSSELLLQVDPSTAGIPWEMLRSERDAQTDSSEDPWAIRSKMLRTLTTVDYRMNVVDALADASIFIVGNPKVDNKKYGDLPGARQEAISVEKIFVESGAVHRDKICALYSDQPGDPGPSACEIVKTLMSSQWRIIHIAGHGELPPKKDANAGRLGLNQAEPVETSEHLGGVVLSSDDEGESVYLGPQELRQLRTVPELVFVNCCHLAARSQPQLLSASARNRSQFASGVAEELIKLGVRCVIAAGWAVDDHAASQFATALYRSLLNGERFIDAVADARRVAYRCGGNTWAAYQCYGDPDWRLNVKANRTPGAPNNVVARYSNINSSAALSLALRTLRIQSQSVDRLYQAKADLVYLEQTFGDRWGELGRIAEDFADAYGALDLKAEAVDWYRRAVSANDGGASLKATENLGNLLVRMLEAEAKDAAAKCLPLDAKALEGFREAEKIFKRLLMISPTQERYCLLGSLWKRRAIISVQLKQADWLRYVQKMRHYYKRAVDAGRITKVANLYYPLLNLVYADLLLSDSDKKNIARCLNECDQALERKSSENPDFWSEVGKLEMRLCRHVLKKTSKDLLPNIKSDFQHFDKWPSKALDWDSVLKQLEFFYQGLELARPSESVWEDVRSVHQFIDDFRKKSV